MTNVQDGSLSTSSVSTTADHSSKSLWESLTADNPYFSAGAGLVGLTASLAILRTGITRGANLLQRQMLVTLEISSKDKAYSWFLHWMAKYNKGRIGRSPHLAVETVYKQHSTGSVETQFSLIPGPGTHFFKYRKSWLSVNRQRDTKLVDITSGSPWETITITTLSKDRGIFSELLHEARTLAMESQQGKTIVYSAWGIEWRPFGQPRKPRLLESVILDKGVKERILKDVHEFLNNGSWYSNRGIPYRRGYLLYGPPGSGKSSFIQALAGHLDYNICVLNLSERGLTDDRLNHLLSNLPERSIMLLEDIDSAFSKMREQSEEKGYQSSVTFSGLLNALDGVVSSEERLIFMTTNYPDRLDSALIRPGRVDVKELIGMVSDYQLQEMFTRFYDCSEELTQAFVKRVRDTNKYVSAAQLQGLFVYNKGDPNGAINMVQHMVSEVDMPRVTFN